MAFEPSKSPFTFPAGGFVSNLVRVNGASILALLIPTNWTPAPITFAVSIDGTTSFFLRDMDGVEVAVQADTPGAAVMLPEGIIVGWPFVVLFSGSVFGPPGPIIQPGARTIKFITGCAL